MKLKSCLAVVLAVIMTGCNAESGIEDESEASVPVTSAITVDGPQRDLDYIGEQNSEENINTFFSALTLTEKEFYPTESSVHFSGRHLNVDGVEYLSNTCSSIDFVMTGDRIEAVLVSNASDYSEKNRAYLAVVIDGEVTSRIAVENGTNSYVLYEGDKLINAEISLVKLSETTAASLGVKSVTVNATSIAPSRDKELQIEFIGDSITCGYGNEGSAESGVFDTAEENGLSTYAYLTAQALNADCSLVCASGIGLISDCTTQGVLEDYLLMPKMYEYSDIYFELHRSVSELTQWDFGGGSDIVVINLGTNDYTYTGKNEELQAQFGDAYYNFIGQIRENNPDAIIICTLGILGSELYGQIEYAAEQYSDDHADKNIYTYRFDSQSAEDGYGTDYHPSTATHEKAAAALTEYIRALIEN